MVQDHTMSIEHPKVECVWVCVCVCVCVYECVCVCMCKGGCLRNRGLVEMRLMEIHSAKH